MTIAEIQDELSKAGNLARALAAVGKIADMLANAEQVEKDLEAQVRARKEELAAVGEELTKAKAAVTRARERAAETVRAAEAKAGKILAKLDAETRQKNDNAIAALAEVAEQTEAAQRELGDLTRTIYAKKAELGRLEQKIVEAREAARQVIEGSDD